MAPPQQDAHFAHRVIAVPGCLKSQQQQQQPTLIHHCFNFDARYNTSASVLFRLSNHPTIITTSNNNNNKASKPIIFYLQITPDRIESVTKTTHEKQADNAPELELDIVRGQLGRVSDVTSLEFKLHSHGDLITPTDFDLDDCDDDQVRRDLASFKSFASALVFSLYMPHNVLRREHWRTFKWAVTQSASLTDGQRSELERMADIRSLYHGKGGALLSPGNEEEEEATSRSCATTEVVDTPSAYASPPPYDDNGERNRVQSGGGGTSKYVDRPAASGAPPKYNRTEEPNQSSSSFINGRPSNIYLIRGSEDTDDLFVYAKRSRSRSLYPLGDSQHEACKATTKRLCREIAQLQKAVDKLSEQNSELDERQADVEHRQDGVEEAVDCASVDIGELEQECTRLRQRLPEELEDLLAEHMSDRMREHIETVLQDKIPDAIRGCVMDWLREHEDTIRGPVLGPYNEMLEAQVQKYIDDKMIEWQVDINKKMSSVFQH